LQIARLLNSRGYTFVASDYYQPLPPLLQQALGNNTQSRPASCPDNKWLAPTSALLKDFLDYAQQSDHVQLQVTNSYSTSRHSISDTGHGSISELQHTMCSPFIAKALACCFHTTGCTNGTHHVLIHKTNAHLTAQVVGLQHKIPTTADMLCPIMSTSMIDSGHLVEDQRSGPVTL